MSARFGSTRAGSLAQCSLPSCAPGVASKHCLGSARCPLAGRPTKDAAASPAADAWLRPSSTRPSRPSVRQRTLGRKIPKRRRPRTLTLAHIAERRALTRQAHWARQPKRGAIASSSTREHRATKRSAPALTAEELERVRSRLAITSQKAANTEAELAQGARSARGSREAPVGSGRQLGRDGQREGKRRAAW